MAAVQSVCGYDEAVRQASYEDSVQSLHIQKKCKKNWDCPVSYNFTGCLAHLEIIKDFTLSFILQISGIKEHNKVCNEGLMKHILYCRCMITLFGHVTCDGPNKI